MDPSDYEKYFWEPPVFTCPYGTDVGNNCEWIGTFWGKNSRKLTEVLGYETVSVASGTYNNTMKIRETRYDANDDIYDSDILWVDKNAGWVKCLYEDSGDIIELIEYSPAK